MESDEEDCKVPRCCELAWARYPEFLRARGSEIDGFGPYYESFAAKDHLSGFSGAGFSPLLFRSPVRCSGVLKLPCFQLGL